MTKTALIVSILAGLLFWQTTFAQTIRNTQNSVDYGSRSNLTVDPITHALQLQIPLGAYPQRNGGLPVTLFYSSKLWDIGYPAEFRCGPINFPAETNYRSFALYGRQSDAGWTSSVRSPVSGGDGSPQIYDGNGQPTNVWNGFSRIVARVGASLLDGSQHELRQSDNTYPVGTVFGGKFYATDSSRLVYDKDAEIMYLPDGSRSEINRSTGQIIYRDRNGNQMTYDYNQATDSLDRIITSPFPTSLFTGEETNAVATDRTYALAGLNGQPVNYRMSWRKLSDAGVISEQETVQTLKYKGDWVGPACNSIPLTSPEDALFFSLDTENQMGRGSLFNPVVLYQIELPNGQTYTFKYNIYGEISKIIYPTGGYERFVYDETTGISGSFGMDAYGRPTLYGQANRGVTGRWVSADGTAQSELYYSYSGNGSVTYPDGTRNELGYYQKPNYQELIKHGFDNPLYGKIYEERQLAADGALLRRKLTEWATDGNIEANSPYIAYKTRNPRITREVSIVFEPNAVAALAQLSEIVYDSHTDPAYFANLNPKQTKTYHYIAVDLTTAQTANITTIGSLFTSANLAGSTETDYLYDENYKTRNLTSLAIETRVKDRNGIVVAKSQVAYDEAAYPLINSGTTSQWQDPNTIYRGNVTTSRSWTDIVANQFVESHAQYDNFGNLRKSWDARGNLSEVEYSSTYNYAYPTKTISPIADASGVNGSNQVFETTTTFDFTTGLPLSATDANGQTSSVEYNDALLRPTRTIAPNGHQTITEYGAGTTSATRFVKVRTQIDESKWQEGYSWYDGIGRVVKAQAVDSAGDVFTETEYDNMSRAKKATNPYRTGDTKLWTESFYDDLGRVTKIKTPDLAEVLTAYSLATTGANIGAVVTVTDQAGKLRRSITNGLGQLTRVDEPNEANQLGSINAPVQPTLYQYDTLNNLTQVVQGSQTRSFVYDNLSRLKQATNPEAGIMQYQYDANGNLQMKTNARGITTTFAYDNLNRVKTRSYSDGTTPPVAYFYDNLQNAKGKLIKVSSSISTTEYTSFDILGRVLAHQQMTDGNTYTTAYSYNLSGALIEETYPSGRVVKNVLDTDGDLSIVQSKKNQAAGYFNYAKNFTYTAAGAVSSMQLGNGKWESTAFNSRLQPTQIALGTVQNGTDKLKLNYDYGTTQNNGNVLSQQITVPTVGANQGFTATQVYTYDSLNRLKSAVENIGATQTWKQTFTFDRYGNRNFDTANTTTLSSCPTNQCNPTIDATNNRFTTGQGYTFDLAGNLITDAQDRSFTYDAENKQKEVKDVNNVSIGNYLYDSDGKRVKKISNSENTIFVYDALGKLVAEYSNQTAQTPQVSYLITDHLESPRINTDANGNVISRHDYQPFGEEIYTAQRIANLGYQADNIREKFATYERDIESELDYAQARYYNPKHGRFTGVDPLLSSATIYDPQTWNRYSYAINSPLKYTDPFGMYICDGDKKQCQNIENGIKKGQEALKKLDPKSDQYKALNRALNTYGAAGVNNGLTIKFGVNASGAPATTVMKVLDSDQDGKKDVTADNPTGRDITVTFDTKQHDNSTDYAINLAHEGSHVADGTDFIGALPLNLGSDAATEMFSNSPLNLTKYETETRAYGVSAAVAQGLGIGSLEIGKKGGNKYEIWNSGWKQADRLTKQSKGIDKVLAEPKSKGGLYEVTKDKPGVKIF